MPYMGNGGRLFIALAGVITAALATVREVSRFREHRAEMEFRSAELEFRKAELALRKTNQK